MIRDLLFLTIRGLRHRPIRSWLTVLGVVIGIMLVVMIMVLGSGVQSVITRMLQGFGSNLVMIYPGEETNPFSGIIGGQRFREEDINALSHIAGVDAVVPVDQSSLNTEFKGEKKTILVVAGPARGMRDVFESQQGIKVEEGRWIATDDASEVVLGYRVFTEMFKEPVHLGDDLIIKSKRFKIVGYVSEVGSSDDNQVYIPLSIYHQITGTKNGVMSGMVKTTPDANVGLIVQQIKYELSKQDTVREFAVVSIEKAGRIVGDILGVIELILVAIAFMSLIVGAVGIMNTMYTSVLERTKQIGVMKAVGASSDAILSLFLIEAGIVGLVGGIMGAALGIGLAYLVGIGAAAAGFEGLFNVGSIDWLGILSVLIITFLTGILSGVLPARRASHMEPADALRYE